MTMRWACIALVAALCLLLELSSYTQAFSPSSGGLGGRVSACRGSTARARCPFVPRSLRASSISRLRMQTGGNGGKDEEGRTREEKEKIILMKSRELTPEEEKAGEVGLSQYAEGEGTQYTQPPTKRQEELGTAYVRMTGEKLSYSRLVLDRLSDSFQETFSGKHAQPSVKREKIVILGTGWGAHALVKSLDASTFDVTVISPRNYFVFTPMLAGAATGTVELRSITGELKKAPKRSFLMCLAIRISVQSFEDCYVQCVRAGNGLENLALFTL